VPERRDVRRMRGGVEPAYGGRRWLILSVLCITLLLISLDTTILNVALPAVVRGLQATSAQLQWIVDAYAVTFASLLLTLGALGDRLGRKWVFAAGLAIFGSGSVFAAVSASPGQLTAARAVMGVGAAALMPCTLSILTNVFVEEADRAKAIGYWAATAGLGVAVGPIFGGFLLDHYWWGSVFLINVPICIVGLVATLVVVPDSKNPVPQPVDLVGAALSMSGLGLLVWGIIEAPSRTWTAPAVIAALVGAVVILGGFVLWERRSRHPMLPLRFFSDRRYSAAIGSLALVLFALLGLFFLMTQYLQFGLGYTPFQTGLRIAPVALVLLIGAPISTVATRRMGTKPVVAGGLVMVSVALGLLSRTTTSSSYSSLLPWFAVIGLGVGLALAPSIESILGSLPKALAGVGSATSDTSMQTGGALGVAVLGTALNFRYQSYLRPLLVHQPIPAGVTKLILGSIGGAMAVANNLPAQDGQALADAARRGFVSGMDLGLLIGCAVVGAAAMVILVALPNRPTSGPR